MKKALILLAATFLSLGILTARAQSGGHPGGGPGFDARFSKFFGENQTFTAALEIQTAGGAAAQAMTMPGKISYDTGKSRFEMNASDIKGSGLPPSAAVQMKAMGMDEIVTITRPDKKATYLIYPGLQSYLETPPAKGDEASPDDLKIETTEIGKETVDGHDCVKIKAVVTGKDGVKHESTLWNATDLKKFPVKIEFSEQGQKISMLFKDVSFKKPEASKFEAPAAYTKYTSIQDMMQAVMKKMGAPAARPPGQ